MDRLFAKLMPRRGVWSVFERDELDPDRTVTPTTAWTFKDVNSERGTEQWSALGFDKNVFPRPKPVGLIRRLLQIATNENDIVLDFFAGSGTTAQAVLEMNQEVGGARKFILSQLPEHTGRDEYRTIADICKERVRRVIAKLDSEGESRLNLESEPAEVRGFRVFRLMSSNFSTWDGSYTSQEDVSTQLRFISDHRVDGRSQADILTELLLKAGYPLASPVEELNLAGVAVYSVANGALLVCLAGSLSIDVFEAMVEVEPAMILVLDGGFGGSDELKVNALQSVRARNQRTSSDIVLRVV